MASLLKLESGFLFLLENGDFLLLEGLPPEPCKEIVFSIMRNTPAATVGTMSNLPVGVTGPMC